MLSSFAFFFKRLMNRFVLLSVHVEIFSPYMQRFQLLSNTSFAFPATTNNPMTMEVLEGFCDRLRVTELENEEVLIGMDLVGDVVSRGRNFLLMKLLSNTYHNRETLKATISKF